MLSTVDPPTPRPKPPAKLRRSSSARLKTSPPPPYRLPADEMAEPTLETLLGSPVSVTAQMLGYFASQNPGAIPEEWINSKSREELRELLARAEQTIKAREGGMYPHECQCLFPHVVFVFRAGPEFRIHSPGEHIYEDKP